MSATDTKEATSAASQTVNEVCQEAMSCYEKDLIESSLSALQFNVHSALDTNAKISPSGDCTPIT
jgi:hypothetical protein